MRIPEKTSPIIILALVLLTIGLTLLWWNAKETVNRQFDAINKIVEKGSKDKISKLKSESEEEWIGYHNDKYNYSIRIPAIYGPDLLKGAMYGLKDELEKVKSVDNLELMDWTDCGGGTSFKISATENQNELFCGQLKSEKNCEIEDAVFAGLKAKNYSCEIKTLREEDFYAYSIKQGICFEKDNKFYEISRSIEEQEVSEDMFGIFDASSDLFKKTLAGFKFD